MLSMHIPLQVPRAFQARLDPVQFTFLMESLTGFAPVNTSFADWPLKLLEYNDTTTLYRVNHRFTLEPTNTMIYIIYP
jgi:hypothetical protein